MEPHFQGRQNTHQANAGQESKSENIVSEVDIVEMD